MKQRKSNLKGLWADPRKRTMVIIMGGLVVTMLFVGFLSGGGDEATDGATGTRTVTAPNIESRPGLSQDLQYNQAVRDENAERLRQAQESGSTVLPTLESGEAPPPLDPLANAAAPDELPDSLELPPMIQAPVPAPVVTQPEPQPVAAVQSPPPPPPPPAVDISRTPRYQSVQNQLQGYMAAWAPAAAGQEFQYNGVMPEQVAPAASGNPSQDMMAPASGAPAGNSGASFVRAGTIIPAVLMTSINSDVPGPVVAQVVSGPLSGARVLGSFQATEKHVVLQFHTISIPGQDRSFSVSAYAVNDNLGVGLATDVNNHYMRRYGMLLAAGFLEGYSSAVARSGTRTNITDGGSVIITQDELDTDQIRKVALGQAGTSVASEMAQQTRIRPTVKVEGKDGGGVPIGLLFMNDF